MTVDGTMQMPSQLSLQCDCLRHCCLQASCSEAAKWGSELRNQIHSRSCLLATTQAFTLAPADSVALLQAQQPL